jgi:glycosyltransferase involved in cell wall biosynthesis
MVLSSDYEGLPAVVMEALACNVPVVTTESFFAARDLLGRSESCAVVPIGDAQALAAAIDRCLQAERTEDLCKIAEPYRVDSAVRAHIDALARAVAAQNRTDTPV